MRILVVDDKASMREVVRACLEAHDYDVIESGCYADAISALCGEDVDLVISDVEYPINGPGSDREAGICLARDAEALRIPVILMSGRPLDCGAHPEVLHIPFLRKPFDLDDLMAAVAGLLKVAV